MARYQFLSPPWMDAARAIYNAHRSEAPPVDVPLRANLVITDTPFGEDPLEAHLDTSRGELELDLGHLDAPDVTLTLEYETAKAQIVAQDTSAVIQAFMAGRIKIEGDMAKVLGLATGQIASEGGEAMTRQVAAELQAITE
jgi:hypothetical protein